ncbi:MAG: hypothetical protein RDU59_01345 [Thermodesulfobacteriota bacterium]|nr:hypothetical protein [Thermodesulfobacteriota bacterium]
MMACNDMSLANQGLTEWKKEQPKMKKSRQLGAGMYFVRTQLAHLHEGLKVIEEIRADPTLMAHVAACDQETQRSFQKLVPFLPGESNRFEFEQLIGRVRHNLTFHYDQSGKLIENAIRDRAARAEARQSSVTRGSTAHLWHFKVADDVVDSIVVRQIWKIPRSADLRVEADKIANRVHQIFLWFVDFSGEFIWRYCKT